MKLNLDCIRTVLLYVENNIKLTSHNDGIFLKTEIVSSEMIQNIPDESPEDIVYSVLMLEEAGYLRAYVKGNEQHISKFVVYDLTYTGHEYLETVRDHAVWSQTKAIAKSVGSYSLSTITEIAKNIISTAVSGFISQL